MISSEPGVKWIWICLLMMARSFPSAPWRRSYRLLHLLPWISAASAARKRVSAQSWRRPACVTSPFLRQMTKAVSNSVSKCALPPVRP